MMLVKGGHQSSGARLPASLGHWTRADAAALDSGRLSKRRNRKLRYARRKIREYAEQLASPEPGPRRPVERTRSERAAPRPPPPRDAPRRHASQPAASAALPRVTAPVDATPALPRLAPPRAAEPPRPRRPRRDGASARDDDAPRRSPRADARVRRVELAQTVATEVLPLLLADLCECARDALMDLLAAQRRPSTPSAGELHSQFARLHLPFVGRPYRAVPLPRPSRGALEAHWRRAAEALSLPREDLADVYRRSFGEPCGGLSMAQLMQRVLPVLSGIAAAREDPLEVAGRAAKESEIPNFKGSDLGHFPLVSADFWTSDHLSERSRSVDAFSGTRARGTLTLKRR